MWSEATVNLTSSVSGIITPTTMSTIFEFERRFDHSAFHSWFSANWTSVFWISAVYLIAIFSTRCWMSNRAAFDLRMPLIVWNVVLAAFSVAGAMRTVPELIDVLRRPDGGWIESICSPSFYIERPTSFWAAAFVMSKVS
jgi:elongation of very long chain fatty acids protein 6